jgi:hypothetical protein
MPSDYKPSMADNDRAMTLLDLSVLFGDSTVVAFLEVSLVSTCVFSTVLTNEG